MNPVKTIDDAIPEELLAGVMKEIASKGFMYGWHSNKNMPFSHWNRTFGGRHRLNREDVEDVIPEAVQTVWKHLEANHLPGMTLVRSYANAHTYGTDGYPHRDSSDPKDRTIVCYLNPDWKIEWAGETVFFNGQEIAHAVMPKFKRITCFPSVLMHAGRGVSRMCPVARMVLVYKARVP